MMNAIRNLAVFLSGSGSNFAAILDAIKREELPARVTLLVSSSPDAYGVVRAREAGIPVYVVEKRKEIPIAERNALLLSALESHDVEFIALAGYLRMIPPAVIERYRNRIANIHPGPLPQFGGKGMYGLHVHEAVLAAGMVSTCATVHLVDEIYDHGRILATQSVPVRREDTPESLAERVLAAEHSLYPRVLAGIIRGEYD